MKTLTWQLIIPLTIISFVFVTKWWYALPADAPDTMYTGFPLIYSGAAWHTSMAYQIFVAEFLIDILTYFLTWFIVIYCINRFWFTIKLPRLVTTIVWSFSVLIMGLYTLTASFSDNVYYFKKSYPMIIKETGYHFFWQHTQRPD